MDEIIEPLRSLDWEDIGAVQRQAGAALAQIAGRPDILAAALRQIPARPELLRLCEHQERYSVDKLILYSDAESGIRVRLHVFLPGHADLPHNHRWTFATSILRGGYRHLVYGDAPKGVMPPIVHARHEGPGDGYVLHHSVVHAVAAEPNTVSLVIRGPAVKDRSLVFDRQKSWWHYSATQDSAEDSARKELTPARLRELTGLLEDWGLSA
ncbi:hypothetical protein [Nocardia niwae]|uniref:Cysteine dioxygenase n=1 Tax=Nocardia niwae TaxID=626084 RepID=A0ABV2X930_9NOCA|nr:hypothetical protein [Nocardia niwae]